MGALLTPIVQAMANGAASAKNALVIALFWAIAIVAITGAGEFLHQPDAALFFCLWPARRLGWAIGRRGALWSGAALLLGLGWYENPADLARTWTDWGNGLSSACILGAIAWLRAHEHAVQRKLIETDSLTGLLNQVGFRRQLAEYTRSAAVTVVCLDGNDFKMFNDTLGHPAGDQFLWEASQVLRRFADQGLAARLGGDEFGLAWKISDEGEVRARLEEIERELAGLSERFPRSVSWCLGAAIGREGESSEDLMIRADRIMLAGKVSGKQSTRIDIDLPHT
jgi:diguanylate cyclase (GGDEF)-like protein